MSYRNPIEVFYYDKAFLEVRTVKAQTTQKWVRLVALPPLTAGWRIHNRGAYTIAYAYQEAPAKWELLEAGVADYKTFTPREVWVSNIETIATRDCDVYCEYWIPEKEDERQKNEPDIWTQLKKAFEIFHRMARRK